METLIETELDSLRLLTVQDTAAVLNMPPRIVYHMIMRKHMRATKVGGQWRILASEVAKVMQGLNEL